MDIYVYLYETGAALSHYLHLSFLAMTHSVHIAQKYFASFHFTPYPGSIIATLMTVSLSPARDADILLQPS
jgi:hypothetical protein